MKGRRIVIMMVCAMAALLMACAGTALAEPELYTGYVELYSEGGFPASMSIPINMFSENTFEDYMIEQLNAQTAEIDISSYDLTPEELPVVLGTMLNSHPELFFVSGQYGYSADSVKAFSVLPTYKYTGDELASMKAIFNSGVSAIVSYARAADTDIGRMLRASDYMCVHYEYDTTYSIYSPELLFKHGTGVCQAYMLAYRAALNQLGITNITVSSDAIDHTWNMVYLDGSWYHIDVTWNDPVADRPMRAYHTNFLLSDAGITATGHSGWTDGWETVVSASNTKYDDFFWIELYQAASMDGDVIYYVDSDYTTPSRTIYAYDIENGSTSTFMEYDTGYGAYYQGFNPIWVDGDTVYYAVRDSLYSVSAKGGEPSLIYSTGNADEWLFYPYKSGSELKIYAAVSPTDGGHLHTCPLKVVYTLEMETAVVRTDIGGTVQLNAVLSPASDEAVIEWSSADETIASVDENGLVTGEGAGVVRITARYDEDTAAECTVVVNAEEVLYLPADTVEIQDEAFANIASGMIELPEGVVTIGSRAFADNENLLLVSLPDSLETIAENAFSGSENVTLLCSEGSAGAKLADDKSIPCVILP